MKFISVNTLKCPECPLEPVLCVVRILIDHTKLAIQQAYPAFNRNHCARNRIIAADQIGSFTTGDFQTLSIYIFFPCFLIPVRELNSIPSGFPLFIALYIKYRGTAKPLLIYQIILNITDPARSKNLCSAPGTTLLGFNAFGNSGANQHGVEACYQFRTNLRGSTVFNASFGIVIRGPDDVSSCGTIKKDRSPVSSSRRSSRGSGRRSPVKDGAGQSRCPQQCRVIIHYGIFTDIE